MFQRLRPQNQCSPEKCEKSKSRISELCGPKFFSFKMLGLLVGRPKMAETEISNWKNSARLDPLRSIRLTRMMEEDSPMRIARVISLWIQISCGSHSVKWMKIWLTLSNPRPKLSNKICQVPVSNAHPTIPTFKCYNNNNNNNNNNKGSTGTRTPAQLTGFSLKKIPYTVFQCQRASSHKLHDDGLHHHPSTGLRG